MKKVAFLLFIIFATVQLVPAVMTFFPNGTSLFIADEEKGEEKGSSTDIKKEKKDYADFMPQSATFTIKINTAFHLTEKIHPSPFPEKLTPPPNFC
ncbi:MAG: hypothetical protein ACM3H8_02110 [Sphingobacteriales bacterium]